MAAKEDFILVFPLGTMGVQTLKVHVSPLSLKDIALQIIRKQELVYGTMCLVQTYQRETIGIVYFGEGDKLKFFVEDNDVERVDEMEDR